MDISEFLKIRRVTGIQRVMIEFLKRAIVNNLTLNIIYFDEQIEEYQQLSCDEVKLFLDAIESYQFKKKTVINLFHYQKRNTIFFDMDLAWNILAKRATLYPLLKAYQFTIVNFIYDLTPLLLPHFAREESKKNFPSFLEAVYDYSDVLFFDSLSTQNDFFALQKSKKSPRTISSHVVYLGSDFLPIQFSSSRLYSSILSTKYILFVGTIEPRKEHSLVLSAYEKLYKKYPKLHLVFIGKIGWRVEHFIKQLNLHPLKDKTIHHLMDIDDKTLSLFYQNAFIVTYLSHYEGYGLPIAESLYYGNVTIASKNSSMPEVGGDLVDYIVERSEQELIDRVSFYYENKMVYNSKKKRIKKEYKVNSWDSFYASIVTTLQKELTHD